MPISNCSCRACRAGLPVPVRGEAATELHNTSATVFTRYMIPGQRKDMKAVRVSSQDAWLGVREEAHTQAQPRTKSPTMLSAAVISGAVSCELIAYCAALSEFHRRRWDHCCPYAVTGTSSCSSRYAFCQVARFAVLDPNAKERAELLLLLPLLLPAASAAGPAAADAAVAAVATAAAASAASNACG